MTRLPAALLITLAALLAPSPPVAASPGDASWTWPVGTAESPPALVRAFDPPARRWLAGHRGVDLAAAQGSVVRAAGSGVVGYAGLLAGRGVVTVVHGELRTTYEPVAASVSPGARVAAGDALGTLQGEGHCAPASCLHWGLRRGEAYLDPLGLLTTGPPRLLPLGAAAMPPGPVGAAGVAAGAPARRAAAPGAGDGAQDRTAAGRAPGASNPTAPAAISLALAAGAAGLLARSRRP